MLFYVSKVPVILYKKHMLLCFQRDMFIVSCDLITDFEFHKLFDIYRLRNPTVTMLFSKTRPELENLPGVKMKKKRMSINSKYNWS